MKFTSFIQVGLTTGSGVSVPDLIMVPVSIDLSHKLHENRPLFLEINKQSVFRHQTPPLDVKNMG